MSPKPSPGSTAEARRLPVGPWHLGGLRPMPVVIKWVSPGALTRAGGCEAGNADLIPGSVSGATPCVVELDPTSPDTGVSTSPKPTVTITFIGASGAETG